jgi:precorrin-6B methylase 2
MLKFSRRNLFPLLRHDDKSNTDARIRAHSDQVDAFLGLQTEKVEKKLRTHGCRIKASVAHERHQELWIGLAAKRFLTPYTEIRTILSLLKPKHGCSIVDLGSAYGRMGFVIGQHYPKIKFIGYEYAGERVKETKRCLKRRRHPLVKIKHADLSSMEFQPIAADYYFIYDYGTQDAIKKTLVDLKKIAREKPITIVARGRESRDAIEEHHPWLEKIAIPRRHIHFSIYRSTENFY